MAIYFQSLKGANISLCFLYDTVSQVLKIVSNVPKLDFLNLSMNPLSGSQLGPDAAEPFLELRRLVLNNTHVSWEVLHTLTRDIPK